MCCNVEKKKIAYLIAGDYFDRKGLVNTVLTKFENLKKKDDFVIDVFFIQIYWGWLARRLKPDRPPKLKREKQISIDGYVVNVIWKDFSFIDYFLSVRLGKAPIMERLFIKRVSQKLKGYDLVSTHSLLCSEIALAARRKYGVPYVASWYGSDIHSVPFENGYYKGRTIDTLDHAAHNFMCSKMLWKVSEQLSVTAKRSLLYNGLRPGFFKYDEAKRAEVRKKYNSEGNKIVAFAGGFIEVKNPQLLPEIFKSVDVKSNNKVEFWVIGNGKMLPYVVQKLEEYQLRFTKWGYVADEIMPDLMNCIDVVVLPSRNEGLPLITVEGMACGANVVGSKVGGIPEAIGDENCFALDDKFIDNISSRIVDMLNGNIEQTVAPCFYWEDITDRENLKYKEILQ